MQLSLSEQLAYSTVRIECDYADGTKGTGTGFFFRFHENRETGRYVPVVITNKHVINGASKGRLIFTRANEQNEPLDTEHFQVYFDDFDKFWIKHADVDVDLCAMAIAPFLNVAHRRAEKLFFISLDRSLIPSTEQAQELSALEQIIMIGYPNGIWDTVNNKPIFRRGVTATHPNIDYCGKKEFMIDAACFPGSSGSPVFIFNEGGYQNKRGNLKIGTSRLILLGALYAGPQHTAEGELEILTVATGQKSITRSLIPNNLGLVIKAERIFELEQLFKPH